MTRAIRQFLLPTVLVAMLLVPAQAAIAAPIDVLRDCADSDSIDREHSKADLQAARGQIPSDLAEYGNCASLITAALADQAKQSKSDSNGDGDDGSSATADLDGDGVVSPAEKRAAVKKAKNKRERKQQLATIGDGLSQDDGAGSFDDDSGGNSLPLILALVALLCAGAGGGIWYAAKRNPGFADALRRVPIPFKRS